MQPFDSSVLNVPNRRRPPTVLSVKEEPELRLHPAAPQPSRPSGKSGPTSRLVVSAEELGGTAAAVRHMQAEERRVQAARGEGLSQAT